MHLLYYQVGSYFASQKGSHRRGVQRLLLHPGQSGHGRDGLLSEEAEVSGQPGLRLQSCYKADGNRRGAGYDVQHPRGTGQLALGIEL